MKTYHLIGPKGGYWRPGGKGYTTDIKEAGVYLEWEAKYIVADAHGEVKMIEVIKSDPGSRISPMDLEFALLAAIENRSLSGDYPVSFASLPDLRANLAYLRKHGTLEIR